MLLIWLNREKKLWKTAKSKATQRKRNVWLFFFILLIKIFEPYQMNWCRVCAVFVNHIHIPHRHTHAHCANMECWYTHERPRLIFSFHSMHAYCCLCRSYNLAFLPHIYQQLATTIGIFYFLKIVRNFRPLHFDLMRMQFAELWHWNWHCFSCSTQMVL